MRLGLDEIARAVGGALEGSGAAAAQGYSIDSRTLRPGELFFAVRGPRFDGHAFVDAALAARAVGAVVDAGYEGKPGPGVLVRVSSTVEALQTLARYVRRLWGKPIVGVTGSAGKTTTKEAIAAVLAMKETVLRSIGNLNNEFGLPLCLLRVEPYQTVGVLEMGMSAKGEIRKLAGIAEPNEGVVTNVGAVHLEFFESIEGIAAAKAELLDGLISPRVAYLNADDSRVRAMSRRFNGRIVTYATKTPAAYRVTAVTDLGLEGTAFTVTHARREVRFTLPLLGRHNVANASAAIAVGAEHGIGWGELQAAIAGLRPEKMRGQVVRFREGFAVLDDTYNSNPRALSEMIRFTAKLRGFERKLIVAGEMLELGPAGAELHRACGREAAAAGAALILGVRGEARSILEGAREAGAAEDTLRFVADAAEAGEVLARTVRRGDVVLIKGSRGVRLEKVLDTLRASFESLEP